MNDRWFTGPQFLLKNEQNWPQKLLQFSSLISEEIRPHLLMVHSNASDASESCIDFNRFSKWQNLVKSISLIYKFLYKLKRITLLISEYINMAKTYIYCSIQCQHFKVEIAALYSENKNISKSSLLYKCSPYLDEHNVLRIGGRIDAATNQCETVKRPIILPRDDYSSSHPP